MIAPRSDCRTVFILAQNIPEITNLKPNSNVQIAVYTAIAVQITCLYVNRQPTQGTCPDRRVTKFRLKKQ